MPSNTNKLQLFYKEKWTKLVKTKNTWCCNCSENFSGSTEYLSDIYTAGPDFCKQEQICTKK